MYKVEICANDDSFLEFGVPEFMEEVSLSDYCDFIAESDALQLWLSEQPEDVSLYDPAFQAEYITRMAKCVSAYTGEDMEEIFNIKVGDYDKHIKQYLGKEVESNIDVSSLEETLLSIYTIMFDVMGRYKPNIYTKDFTFEYKGEKYIIPHIAKSRFSGQSIPSDLTLHEVVEMLDLRRRVAADKVTAANDSKFGLLLRQMAILARKEGEQLPTGDTAFDRFVNDRAAHFQEITANIALDLDFFLSNSLGLLSSTLDCLIYSIPLNKLLETLKKAKDSLNKSEKMRSSITA